MTFLRVQTKLISLKLRNVFAALLLFTHFTHVQYCLSFMNEANTISSTRAVLSFRRHRSCDILRWSGFGTTVQYSVFKRRDLQDCLSHYGPLMSSALPYLLTK